MKRMKRVNLDVFVGDGRLRIAASGDLNDREVRRSEGGVGMRLVDPVLAIECETVELDSIHGDILGLIGVLAFHPVLPRAPFILNLNFAASEGLQNALDRREILPGVRVMSRTKVQAYQARKQAVVSYGGGFDSLAAHLLLPDLPIVHESPLPSRSGMYQDVVNDIVDDFDVESHKVFDNLRQLYTAWGLPLWVSVYIAALLLQPRYILSGSEMTGTYLFGGQEYRPRHGNLWYEVFADVGLNILPTSFLSEVGNVRIVAAHGKMQDAAYCQFIRQRDCDRCTKCLRRRLLRGLVDSDELALVDNFVQSESIYKFLANRPLYYGDVFSHAVAGQARSTWVNEHLFDLLDQLGALAFHERYYQVAFDHFDYPTSLRILLEDRLEGIGIAPFDASTLAVFENFRQLPST